MRLLCILDLNKLEVLEIVTLSGVVTMRILVPVAMDEVKVDT